MNHHRCLTEQASDTTDKPRYIIGAIEKGLTTLKTEIFFAKLEIQLHHKLLEDEKKRKTRPSCTQFVYKNLELKQR